MVPQPPDGLDRWNWFNVEPLSPDEFDLQRSAEWTWAEIVQAAFRKGQKDESEEQYQAEWEKKHKGDAAQPTPAEAASLERLKGRQ